jgi:hypothetical protein
MSYSVTPILHSEESKAGLHKVQMRTRKAQEIAPFWVFIPENWYKKE